MSRMKVFAQWEIFVTARRYASMIYAVVMCLCLSHSSIVSKRLDLGSFK